MSEYEYHVEPGVDPDDEDEEYGHMVIATHKKTGRDIGHLHVHDHSDSSFSIGDVQVDKEHRRKGVATEMINKMREHLGGAHPTGATSGFTDAGHAMWVGYNKKLAKTQKA